MAWIGVWRFGPEAQAVPAIGFGDDTVARINADSTERTAAIVFLAVLAVLVSPLCLVVLSAVRVASERRSRRIAALRLAGATQRQAVAVLAGEVLLGCLTGEALAWLLFLLGRPLLAAWQPAGLTFWPSDAQPGWLGLLATAALPLFVVWVVRLSARRALRSPYAERRVVVKSVPHMSRLIPLATGIAVLALLAAHRPASATNDQTLLLWALYLGAVLCLVGVPLALPLVVGCVARWRARRTTHLARQLAATRLHRGQDDTSRSAAALALGMVGLAATALLLGMFDHSATDFLRAAAAAPAGRVVVVDHPNADVVSADFSTTRHVRGAVALRVYQPVPSGPGDVSSLLSVWVASCHDLQTIWQRPVGCEGNRIVRVAWPHLAPQLAAGQHIDVAYATDPLPGSRQLQLTAPGDTLHVPDIPGAATFQADLLVPPTSAAIPGGAPPLPRAELIFTDGSAAGDSAVRSRVLAIDPTAVLDSTASQLVQAQGSIAPYYAVTWSAAAAIALLLVVTLGITAYDAATGRRRITAVLVVVGADTATLRRSQLWYLGFPLSVGAGLAVMVDVLFTSALDRITTGTLRLHPITAMALVAVAVVGLLVTAPAAWVVTGRRQDPGALRVE